MKTAIIAPTGLLPKYATTKYHLMLPHVMWEDKRYEDFYYQVGLKGEYIIMDNSVIELGHPIEWPEMRGSILRINPDEVVLPDLPGHPATTFDYIRDSAKQYKDEFPDIKLMAVPQGSDAGFWLKYHDAILNECPEVDVIGIPKSLKTHRKAVCAYLDGGKRHSDKEYHLLGTWGNPLEVKHLSGYEWIRGVDTKAPVRFGQLGVMFSPLLGLIDPALRDAAPPLRFDYPLDPLPSVTASNVASFFHWANGT